MASNTNKKAPVADLLPEDAKPPPAKQFVYGVALDKQFEDGYDPTKMPPPEAMSPTVLDQWKRWRARAETAPVRAGVGQSAAAIAFLPEHTPAQTVLDLISGRATDAQPPKPKPRSLRSLSTSLQAMAEIERLMLGLNEKDRRIVYHWYVREYDPEMTP